MSSEGEGIFVIDDPSAYYLDDRDSDEERRKRTAQKQVIINAVLALKC